MMQERFFPIVENGYSPISPLGDVTDPTGAIQSSLFMSASEIADVVAQTAEQAARQVGQESLAEQARRTGRDVEGALRREGALLQARETLQTATTGRNIMLLGLGAVGILGLGWLIWGRRR
jgi:hypothetical protein